MRDICTGEKMERKKEKNGNQDKTNAITADKEVSVERRQDVPRSKIFFSI